MSAAELTNSSGKKLDGGPITVFDGSSYSGEALIETFRPLDKRLISYAVDLGTRVTTQFDSSEQLTREIHATRGVVTTTTGMQETKTYTIKNVDAKAKTLIVEHPQRPGYKLLSGKPSETTSNAYRFEVSLPASATEKFAVNEERLYNQSVSVSDLDFMAVFAYVQNKALPGSARQQMQKIGELKRQIAETDTKLRQNETDINDLIKDQERIRQNIGSLNNVSGQQQQVQEYSRSLAEQESKLAGLRDASSELRKHKTGLEAGLASAIEKLSF